MDRTAQLVAHNTQEQQEQGKPPKSGLKRDNTEQVCRVILWPHEHVVRHVGKPPTYESLTLSEFAAGSMRILTQIPQLPPLAHSMTAYLAELFDDITDTDWQSVWFAHRLVLQDIENGNSDYSNLPGVRLLRTTALNRATRRLPSATATGPSQPTTQPRTRPWQSNQAQPTKKPCLAFLKGECQQQKSHNSTQGYIYHACAYCLSMVGRAYNHPGSECRRKAQAQKDSKNEEQGQ